MSEYEETLSEHVGDSFAALNKMSHSLRHRMAMNDSGRIRDLEAEVDQMRETFGHYHVNAGDGSDACRQCGLDLRNPIHAVGVSK